MSVTQPLESGEESHIFDRKAGIRFFALAKGWWLGPTARTAWFLTLALASLLVLNVGVNFLINAWNRRFFDALGAHQGSQLGGAVAHILMLVAMSATIGVGVVWCRETLQVRWREWLINDLVRRWLDKQRFFRMGQNHAEPQNPEYLIADDTRMATEPIVDFCIGILSAVVSAITFVGVLFTVGGSLNVNWGGTPISIPAFMVLAAIVYGLLVSSMIGLVGKPLPGEVAKRNEAEARLRFDLTRLRENAESVALIRGEHDERRAIRSTYDQVVKRWLSVVKRHVHITWITHSSGVFVPILPLLLASPKYLAGELTLGEVTQLAGAFVQVQAAIVWVVDNFNPLAQCYASMTRVNALEEAIERIDLTPDDGAIVRGSTDDGSLVLDHLRLDNRAGAVLMPACSLTIRAGERVILTGKSGSGKSVLVRALAGLWPWGCGEIRMPADRSVLFVPQRSYLPRGVLRDILNYPSRDHVCDSVALGRVLEEVGLPHLIVRLDEAAPWDSLLSNGERQRLAIARVLLHEPDVVVFDGAISELDEPSLRGIFTLLDERLPMTTRITITERAVLDAFHDRRLTLVNQDDTFALLDEPISAVGRQRTPRLRLAKPQ